MSSHLFHIDSMPPQRESDFGSRTDASRLDMPVLSGMALSVLTLLPKGMMEPHWCPNANMLGYCVEGKGLVTVLSTGPKVDTFVIEPGTLNFVPKGYLYHIENIGTEQLKFVQCYDNDNPEDLELSTSVGAIPASILGGAFNVKPEVFSELSAEDPLFAVKMAQQPALLKEWETNPFKLNLEAMTPQASDQHGWVKMSNAALMPALKGLSMYSLYVEPQSAREPHWHPNANEVNYLISGRARITLVSPGGHVDTFDMKSGDMSFIPEGYVHVIENISKKPLRFAIFYNDANPVEIGLWGCLRSYSPDLLATLFKVPANTFSGLSKT